MISAQESILQNWLREGQQCSQSVRSNLPLQQAISSLCHPLPMDPSSGSVTCTECLVKISKQKSQSDPEELFSLDQNMFLVRMDGN